MFESREERRILIEKAIFTGMQAANIALIVTDNQGYIIWVNSGFEKITSFSKDEVKNKKPSILCSDKTAKEVYIKLRENILQGKGIFWDFYKQKKGWFSLLFRDGHIPSKRPYREDYRFYRYWKRCNTKGET